MYKVECLVKKIYVWECPACLEVEELDYKPDTLICDNCGERFEPLIIVDYEEEE